MKKMTKSKKIYSAVVIVLFLGGVYYWYTASNSKNVAVQYKTVTAEKGTFTNSISGSGNVIVDQSSTVDPTITGTVANLSVNVGDKVKKGQTLFTIINDDLTVSSAQAIASLQQAQNAVASATLNVSQAKSDYRKGKEDSSNTADEKRILDKKINIAEDGLIAAQKSYSASLSSYNNQMANAAKRTVVAPIDGTVNAVNVKNGDDLSRLSSNSNSSAPIIIGDLSTLKAQVQVNEIDIPNVSVGQNVMLKFNAIDGLNISGKVEKMDSLGTLSSGVVTYNVTIDFDTLDPRIRPEMSVSASIITKVENNVITVPNSAIKSQGNNNFVELLNGSVSVQTKVEIGDANNTETVVTSGISAGDKVITQTINPNAKSTTGAKSGGSGMGFSGLGGGRG
jgi:HlyD family secretion protein